LFKLKYRNAVSVVEVSFESYMDLVYFVASNKIGDDQFVAITLGDREIEGLDNLYGFVTSEIEEAKAAEAESDNDDYCDEDDDCDYYEEEYEEPYIEDEEVEDDHVAETELVADTPATDNDFSEEIISEINRLFEIFD